MLPGKIFLEAIRTEPERAGSSKFTYKLNLILNDIYYDELKQFHTKYLCANSTDVLTIELFAIESQQLLGVAVIPDMYKHMLDNRTIDIKTKSKDASNSDIVVKLSFQTVAAFNRKKSASTKRGEDTIMRSPPKEREKEQPLHQAEMSFNNNREFFNETLGNTSRASLSGTGLIQMQSGMLKQGGEGESLQSLAQQRQKILGELFGKFKRQR